jgi:hypothetical protein
MLLLAVCLSAAEAQSPSVETLFLKDGSIIKGTVLKDGSGVYVVYNNHGKISVNSREVLYRHSAQSEEGSLTETYILLDASAEALSVLQREIPDRKENAESFRLLVPGSVDAVFDEKDIAVPFEAVSLGSLNRLTVRYADLRPNAGSLFITSRQTSLLSPGAPDALEFRQDYTVDREGLLRILVNYPLDWTAETVSPEPTRVFPGLVVWEPTLKRQQRFSPRIHFQLPNRPKE